MIDWLTDTLIATSLLMALVLLVREPARRQFGPAAAYGLWLIPALRLAVPPLTQTIERIVPAAPIPLASLQTAQPMVMIAREASLVEQLGGWQSLAVSAWLAGAAAMLVGGILIYRRQRRQVLRDSVELEPLGTIRIVRSPAVRGPIAFGILDRVIALPSDFEGRFDPDERRLAFEHELSHHRSGDLVVGHFAFALLCLMWFNPLAWLSHAAFRFDQEAACDARVLDKASSPNRAAYAQAIAKAASGRALLFAGALDRPRTLQRRLRSMLASPSFNRRLAGKALIVLTAATALPLTASRATHYVDIPAASPPVPAAAARPEATAPAQAPTAFTAAATTTIAPASAASAASPETSVQENADGSVTLAGGVKLGKGSTAFFANDDVLINGKVNRLEQLTPAERAKIRATILKSQRELAQERTDLPRELAELRREAERARSGELRREIMQDREELQRDLAQVDLEAAELRAEGEDPEKRKAEILRDLREAEAIDIEKEIREAIEAADPRKVEAALRAEEAQMARMLARLDQLERR